MIRAIDVEPLARTSGFTRPTCFVFFAMFDAGREWDAAAIEDLDRFVAHLGRCVHSWC